MGLRVESCDSEEEVLATLGSLIQKKSNDALATGSLFKVGVSGGSLVKFLCKVLPSITTDWTKWRIFFCDERIVPFDNSESTFGTYSKELTGLIPVSVEQFITVNPNVSATEAAEDYRQKMLMYFKPDGFPRFDLLLLGMGPDGHTCSLFPGHPLLKESEKWVAAITDSPKLPPQRITLTLPVINNARCCVFAITGESKALTVKTAIEKPGILPASLVRPTSGDVFWILDKHSASLLSKNAGS